MKKHGKTEFTGYQSFEEDAKILHIAKNEGIAGYEMIFDRNSFYAESGGQVSDTGMVVIGEFEGRVIGVAKKKDVFVHQVEVIKGIVPVKGVNVKLYVDIENRKDIQRNHTATHILHTRIKRKLGTHVEQVDLW